MSNNGLPLTGTVTKDSTRASFFTPAADAPAAVDPDDAHGHSVGAEVESTGRIVGAKKFYHPELDCLRFFAFFAVFFCHVIPQNVDNFKKLGDLPAKFLVNLSQTGSLGVGLFFCLSSFLITALLMREFDLTGTLNIRAFWLRRILRIWPLYYAFIIIAAVGVPYLLPSNRLEGGFLTSFLFFGANWACMFNGYPDSAAAPLWSVSVEEQFYMAWPLLLALVSPKRLVQLVAGCLAVATLARVVILTLGFEHPAIWCNTFTQLDPIALGALFAVYTHKKTWNPSRTTRWCLLAGGLIVPQIMVFAFGQDGFSGKTSLIFYPVAALCCMALLAATYRAEPIMNSTSKVRPALVYLGRISYGLYVFHVLAIQLAIPVFTMVEPYAQSMLGKMLVFVGQPALAFAMTVGLASLSYHFLEMPFLKLKSRFTYVESSPPAVELKPQPA